MDDFERVLEKGLTPLELIDKIAALIPPPLAHRHRYYGVLAPNSPMRAAVTAMAPMPVVVPPLVVTIEADAPPQRAGSHHLWAMLLGRICETRPAVCPNCQSPMHIISNHSKLFFAHFGSMPK